MNFPDTSMICRSCKKEASSLSRWSPVIVRGQITGHTCPACPKFGEPIQRMVNGAGVRFRARLDAGTTERKQVSRSFSSLAQAREFVESKSSELKKARSQGIAMVSSMTVDQCLDDLLRHKDGRVSPVTLENYTNAAKAIRRKIGSRRVDRLDHREIEDLVSWLVREGGHRSRPLARRSAKMSLLVLQQALDRAVRVHNIIGLNIARGVSIPAPASANDAAPLERWTAEELVKFTARADSDIHSVGWRLLTLGLRREEVLGLEWDAVDFKAATITVRRARVRVGKGTDPNGWVIRPPKSKASRRTIRPDDVQPGTMQALRALHMAAGRPETGHVVLDPFGRPVEPLWFSSRFRALCKAAAVPSIKAHSTRHTVAYLLHGAGVPAARAAAYLGHDVAVHLSTYLFAREGDVDTAAVAFGEVLAAARTGS